MKFIGVRQLDGAGLLFRVALASIATAMIINKRTFMYKKALSGKLQPHSVS